MTAIVFGSDQGLVGQFNDVLADFVAKTLDPLPGEKKVWAVGERVQSRLADAGLPPVGLFTVPTSVNAITPLVGQILVESEAHHGKGEIVQLYLFHNRPRPGRPMNPSVNTCCPWMHNGNSGWPISPGRPKTCPRSSVTMSRRCGHSSGSIFLSRSSRLAPNRWQPKTRAAWPPCSEPRKTSTTWWEDLNQTFRRLRQTSIDEELFDVLSGYESYSTDQGPVKVRVIHTDEADLTARTVARLTPRPS